MMVWSLTARVFWAIHDSLRCFSPAAHSCAPHHTIIAPCTNTLHACANQSRLLGA